MLSHETYRHIFWDMGGTIIDTYPQLNAALAEVVTKAGSHVDLNDVALLTHRSTGEAVAVLSQQFGIEAAAFRQAESALKALWRTQPPPPMPGIGEAMAAASGLNLVVTHRDRASATSLLASMGIVVDDLICTSDGFPRKPDPFMYVALLERHGLDATECIGVGDRPIDAYAAHAAGMAAAMLISPGMPRDDEAGYQLESLWDLLALLQ